MISVLLPDGKEVDSKLTDSTGRVVLKSLLGITYSVRASLPGYYDQTLKVALRSREQTSKVALGPVPFFETPLAEVSVAGGVTSIVLAAAFVVLRRRRARRTLRRRWQPSYRPYR